MEDIKEKKVEEVTIVAGVINATGRMLYWRDDEGANIGDYAIVENMNGYDLIKVVAVLKVDKKSVRRFSNTSYENMKKIVSFAEDII